MSEEKLKPCPFCGHTKSRITEKKIAGTYHSRIDPYRDFVRIRYCVMCNKCKAKGKSIFTPRMYYLVTESSGLVRYSAETCNYYKEQAMLAWNIRKGDKE